MKSALACLALGACAAPTVTAPNVGLPFSLMRQDDGTISGVWRQGGAGGLVLTIDQRLGTFAVSRGCANSGGVLHPMEDGRFQLQHYTTGFSVEGCGPWRVSPEIAPLDQPEVTIRRVADRLLVGGGERSLELRRDKLGG